MRTAQIPFYTSLVYWSVSIKFKSDFIPTPAWCQKVMPECHKNEFGVKILFYLSIGDDAQRALKVMPAWHMI